MMRGIKMALAFILGGLYFITFSALFSQNIEGGKIYFGVFFLCLNIVVVFNVINYLVKYWKED